MFSLFRNQIGSFRIILCVNYKREFTFSTPHSTDTHTIIFQLNLYSLYELSSRQILFNSMFAPPQQSSPGSFEFISLFPKLTSIFFSHGILCIGLCLSFLCQTRDLAWNIEMTSVITFQQELRITCHVLTSFLVLLSAVTDKPVRI